MTQTDDRRIAAADGDQPLHLDGLPSQLPDLDPTETAEWLE